MFIYSLDKIGVVFLICPQSTAFKGEWIYKLIPADFLEMSADVSAENIACESSC